MKNHASNSTLYINTRHFVNLLFLVSILLQGCSGCHIIRNPKSRLTTKVMTNSKIIEDIDFFRKIYIEINPYPYMFTNKKITDSLSDKIKNENELTGLEFYKRLNELIGAYNIPHMTTASPTRFKIDMVKSGHFPLVIKLINNEVYIASNLLDEKSILNGNKLMSINGLNADSLFFQFTKYTGGLKKWKYICAQEDYFYFLWMNDVISPFRVVYKDKIGYFHSVVLKGYYKIEKKKIKQENDGKVINNYKGIKANENIEYYGDYITYTRFNDSVAYIQFKSMSFHPDIDYQNFLKKVFSHIKENYTSKLIIDMRGNGGGDSRSGEMLIDYFAYKPYKMAGAKHWKISKAYKKNFLKQLPFFLRPLLQFFEPFKTAFKAPLDSTIKYIGGLHEPGYNSLKYNSQVYLIIDNGTFSSASLTANAIEDNDLAIIVGETGGEVVNDLGEIVPVRLPNSGIVCWIPSALFIRANGDMNNTNPVLPDVFIEQNKLTDMSKKDIVDFIFNLK